MKYPCDDAACVDPDCLVHATPASPAASQPVAPPAGAEVETVIIPSLLFCPKCHAKHVDEGEWETRPHRTHLCLSCGNEWRVTVRGTQFINTIHAAGALPRKDAPGEWHAAQDGCICKCIDGRHSHGYQHRHPYRLVNKLEAENRQLREEREASRWVTLEDSGVLQLRDAILRALAAEAALAATRTALEVANSLLRRTLNTADEQEWSHDVMLFLHPGPDSHPSRKDKQGGHRAGRAGRKV